MTPTELKEKFSQRQRAYQVALNNETGKTILEDLESFCRGKETTFHADPRVHAALEGRREVWLRIRDHLDMAPEEFLKAYLNLNLLEKTR